MPKKNRMARNVGKRRLRMMKRNKKSYGCGVTCMICNPTNFTEQHKNKAALRHMEGLE